MYLQNNIGGVKMAKKIIICIVLIVIITLGAFAGGESDNNAQDRSYRDELGTMEWDKIVELAKQEGEVSWFVWYFQPQFREIAQAFENKYGIKVTIPEGTNDANQTKAISEKGLDTGSIDVLAYGNDAFLKMEKAGILYGPIDGVIPQIETRKTAVGGVDSNGYAVAYWGNQTGLAYDPNKISESQLPQTFDELTQYVQSNSKQFSFCLPSGGGSGPAFIRATIYNLVPQEYSNTLEEDKLAKWDTAWKWFNDNADDYVITSSNADSLTRLSDGEFAITAAWEDHMANLQKQGAISKNLKFYIPRFGMAGSGNFSSVLKNAPNPAAALVFLAWVSSAETQTKFNEIMGASPQNTESDDSYALVSSEMRQYSNIVMPQAYEVELKKRFDIEVTSK